jgi:predicted MPP superfamily phosphohydrolase
VQTTQENATERDSANTPKRRLTRRRFLAVAGGAAAAAVVGYGTLIEPNEIVVERVTMLVKRLAADFDGFRIALISDLHFSPFTGEREISATVEHINALDVDLVAAVGDFVTYVPFRDPRKSARFAEPCAAVLSKARSRHGTFAVLGNHDHATDAKIVAGALGASGIHVLQNGNRAIERGRSRLWIAGIDDALEGNADIRTSLTNIPVGAPVVSLAHEPDMADLMSRYPVSVQLSGHSHGGQVRVPGVGALYLPALARKYPKGLYQVGNMHLYTTRGIGVIGVPVRLDCPPEVTLITLQAA